MLPLPRTRAPREKSLRDWRHGHADAAMRETRPKPAKVVDPQHGVRPILTLAHGRHADSVNAPARRTAVAARAVPGPESATSVMRRTYIHLSDLHFGQEKGSDLHLHRDVRDRLIDDARGLAAREPGGTVAGVIVTGDIAFSGKEAQYLEAGQWLDRLCKAVGCSVNDVFVVPGNHDVDRDAITPGCEAILEKVLKLGEEELERYLQSPLDREVLYWRFKSYRAFAEGYACPIDTESGYTVDRNVQLGPGRFLRLIGVNSALICSRANDEQGGLLLGARQRTFPQDRGQELVVLCHHPLDWLGDSVATTRFVRARARVFMSGHTHSPSSSVAVDGVNGDVLFISAGAAVPPVDEVSYQFTYNKLVFDWDAEADALTVQIEARTWNADATCFAADCDGIGPTTQTLNCPNFQGAGGREVGRETIGRTRASGRTASSDGTETRSGDPVMAEEDALLRLRFFKDLTVTQRAKTLAELGVLPPSDWVVDEMTHTLARRLLDSVLSAGRSGDLRRAMEAATK